jgi:hypothetical protein
MAVDINSRISVIAGMPRAGTTSLYHNLQKHPDVFIPAIKEISYFAHKYDQGEDFYLSFFSKIKNKQVAFDISPFYFFDLSGKTDERMLRFNPELKVILIVRDPVSWIVSVYYEWRNAGIKMPFDDFLLKGHVRHIDGKTLPIKIEWNFIEKRIEKLKGAFNDNLLLIDYSLFTDNPRMVLHAIEAFSGISTYFNDHNFEKRRINASYRRRDSIAVNKLINNSFAKSVVKIMPRKVVMPLRNIFDLLRSEQRTTTDEDLSGHMSLLQDFFGEDIEYVKALFCNHGVILGSGKGYGV